MQESFDTSTVYGKAMLGILSVFAQMERMTIAERTMMGRQGRAEKGYFHGGGTHPIGYDYIDGSLVVNEPEAKQVREVYAYYAMGLSVSEISRRMEGQKTKHGDWSHTSTVGNVLDNPLYAGTVHFDGAKGKGLHTPIVSENIDKRVKAMRANLKRSAGIVDSPYLLTGLIYCAACGARYFPQKRPNGRVVYSCHSRAKKNRKMVKDPNCTAPHIPIEKLDTMVEAEVILLAEDPLIVNEIIKKETAKNSGRKADVASEDIRRLGSEIEALMDQLTQHDSLISVEEIAEKIAHAHAERMRLLPQSRESVPRLYDVEAAKMILHDIRGEWVDLDIRGRRMYLFQLIDKIYINAEENVDIAWSFLRSV
jgi:site-specific DNA recombinase